MLLYLEVELLMFELFAANWRRFRVSCDIVGPGTSTCGPKPAVHWGRQ